MSIAKPSNKKAVNYAFIDSQNLNLGVQSSGWKLDYRKFRLYLKNKYNVSQAYLFIGRVSGNKDLYDALQKAGFKMVFKPTIAYIEDGKKTMKGNVDAELVLYAAAKVYGEYDKTLIVSGDGDFYCLAEFLRDKNKLLHIVVPNNKHSKLLRAYAKYIVRLDLLRDKLEYAGSKNKPALAVGRNLRLSRKGSKSSGRSKP